MDRPYLERVFVCTLCLLGPFVPARIYQDSGLLPRGLAFACSDKGVEEERRAWDKLKQMHNEITVSAGLENDPHEYRSQARMGWSFLFDDCTVLRFGTPLPWLDILIASKSVTPSSRFSDKAGYRAIHIRVHNPATPLLFVLLLSCVDWKRARWYHIPWVETACWPYRFARNTLVAIVIYTIALYLIGYIYLDLILGKPLAFSRLDGHVIDRTVSRCSLVFAAACELLDLWKQSRIPEGED